MAEAYCAQRIIRKEVVGMCSWFVSSPGTMALQMGATCAFSMQNKKLVVCACHSSSSNNLFALREKNCNTVAKVLVKAVRNAKSRH